MEAERESLHQQRADINRREEKAIEDYGTLVQSLTKAGKTVANGMRAQIYQKYEPERKPAASRIDSIDTELNNLVRPGKNVLAVGGLAAGQRVKLTWPVSMLAPVPKTRIPLIVIHAEGIAAGGTMPVSTGVLSRAGTNPRTAPRPQLNP